MKYLFAYWETIRPRIEGSRTVFLLLDYDGTLTPIVPRPELALLAPEAKEVLLRLRDAPHVLVAIISGRSLDDLCDKVGIPGITYVGNHGLEIQNPAGIHKKKLSTNRQKELSRIRAFLQEGLGTIPGILFEDKESILSIHYRLAPRESHGKIFMEMEKIMKKWDARWKLMRGKMVFEIRPRADFHKGKAVHDLLRVVPESGLLPFYFGDDQTDEDAFRWLKGRGITVFVGPPETPSEAEYYLQDPADVTAFLKRLAEVGLVQEGSGEKIEKPG